MKKILVFLFFSSLLVSACGTGSGPVRATSLPATEVETEVSIAEPTAIPTEVPTATYAPTEVPYYTGKTVAEIAELRAQCLLDLGSLCFPLPFEPEESGEIIRVPIHPKILEYQHEYYALLIPAGTQLVAGFEGELVSLTGNVAGSQDFRTLNPLRSVEGLSEVFFGWAPYVHWECADCYPTSGDDPSWGFVLQEAAQCGTLREGIPFEEGDILILTSLGKIPSGQPLAQVNADNLCLFIAKYAVVGPEQYVVSVFTEEDLLKDEFGSIVFVLPD